MSSTRTMSTPTTATTKPAAVATTATKPAATMTATTKPAATTATKPAAPAATPAATPATAVKRAVLVGINYIGDPEGEGRLHGCVNDVLLMRDLLIKRYKFDPKNIQLLIDEGNDGTVKQPTAGNIIVALRSAMKVSKPGDVLYFHFSGHGAYRPDNGSDELDRVDEFLVAPNCQPLVDDFLRGQIASLPEGVKFTFVCDACHSGTMLDQPTSDIQLSGDKGKKLAKAASSRKGHRSREISPDAFIKLLKLHYKTPADYLASLAYLKLDSAEMPLSAGAIQKLTWDEAVELALHAMENDCGTGRVVDKLAKAVHVKTKHLMLLSGCEDHQQSTDAPFGEGNNTKYYGALTYNLVKFINSRSGPISIYDAAKGARDLLHASGYDQNPVLSCDKDMNTKTFIDMM